MALLECRVNPCGSGRNILVSRKVPHNEPVINMPVRKMLVLRISRICVIFASLSRYECGPIHLMRWLNKHLFFLGLSCPMFNLPGFEKG